MRGCAFAREQFGLAGGKLRAGQNKGQPLNNRPAPPHLRMTGRRRPETTMPQRRARLSPALALAVFLAGLFLSAGARAQDTNQTAPPVQKPSVQKLPVQKPAIQKPTVQKPAAAHPA